MKVNPFFEKKAIPVDEQFDDLSKLNTRPYDKNTASPYTKTRAILMNGTEFEMNWFLHQFSRHCKDNTLRREIAKIRRREQQQQKILSGLKPIDESNLETTIAYEQLAVDLTATLAQHVTDERVKNALNFALLEDFDHLYRFANLLQTEQGVLAKDLVGGFTEIMPGRPTYAEHRHPYASINKFICNTTADMFTKLATNIITAAEQQTMNYYMNIGQFHPTSEGRKLYAEIAMIEEQHVSEYGSLLDTTCSWMEMWLMHEYTECYLYYSCAKEEKDKEIKALYERLYLEECGHLQKVAELLEHHDGKSWQCVFTDGGDFPEPLTLGTNIEYIRDVLAKTVTLTRCCDEDYVKIKELPKDSTYLHYNKLVNRHPEEEPAHKVVENNIKLFGEDYRFETKPHPISELADRKKDCNTFPRA